MVSHKSDDYKTTAVKYYLVEDATQEEVCKIFQCNRRSLMRWVKQYKNQGNVERQNRTPIAYKVKRQHIQFVKDEIRKNKTITMEDLLFLLKRKYPSLSLSRFHLNRVINDNNITLKLTRIRHEPTHRWGKEININDKLDEFYEEIKKHKLEDIICIDETSIKSLQKRNHCYSQKGKRCVIKTQSQDVFKRYTGIFAISVNGVEGWELYEKSGINTDRLIEFLEKFITEKYKNKLIILDNAPAHKNEKIREFVNRHNQLLYSVPYQHFSNAIENYFSMLKSRLQKYSGGLKYNNLKENIAHAIERIPIGYYKNIIEGAYNRKEKYVPKNKTRKNPKKMYQ
jgi:transposase-like protein